MAIDGIGGTTGPPAPDGEGGEFLDRFFAAAGAHGDEEGGEAEAGDLQVLLRAAWHVMTAEQRRLVLADEGVAWLLGETPEYEGLL